MKFTKTIASAHIAGILSACLGMFVTGAHASSPILSVANVVTNSSNLGSGATITTYGPDVSASVYGLDTNYNFTTSIVPTSETIIEPTTTTAGLAYDYQTVTTTTTWDHITWKADNLSISVTSDGTNQSGDKWISLTGSVQSTIDTSLSFNLSASGNFTAIQTPLGSAAPLLASFYFGNSQPTPLSATTSTDLAYSSYYTYTSSYSTASFNLLAGVAQNFVAYVYAPTDVSVNSFDLSAHTGDYDYVTTPMGPSVVAGTPTLVGAHTLAPIPEPATVWQFGSGLLLIGLAGIARKKTQV